MRLVLILGLLVLVSGCVHTRPVPLDTPAGRADLNARTSGRVSTLHVRGEPNRSVRNLHIGPDETTWVDRLSGQPQSAPTADVSAVSLRRAALWRSALIGAGVGAAVGALAALTDDGCSSFFCLTPTPAEYVALFGASGAVIGSVVGVSRTERFVPPDAGLRMRLDTLARP